jgi:excisionase family DNA binding protein
MPAPVSNPNTPLLLDTRGAAALVGVQPGVLRRWVHDGLPFVRAGRGGRKMFTRRDLEKWVERLKETVQ